MEYLKNSTLLSDVLKALYMVAGRRTSERYADDTIGASIKTLEGKYDFLKHVTITEKNISDTSFGISVSPSIDSVEPTQIGRALEAIIRMVYSDLDSDAGLYFITELKKHVGEDVKVGMSSLNMDLDQFQLEQHYAYRRQDRKRSDSSDRKGEDSGNPLGYDWSNVSFWRHEPNSKYCTLYDKKGEVLDRLNLDRIIQNYVEKLSGYVDLDTNEMEHEIEIYEKEYELLKLMLSRDMDAETAAAMLHISKDELNAMIRKLSKVEMLQFVSYDTLELTESGISYLAKKGNVKK